MGHISLPHNPPRSPTDAPIFSSNCAFLRGPTQVFRQLVLSMALSSLISATPLSVSVPRYLLLPTRRRFHLPLATLGSSSSQESSASTPTSIPVNGTTLPSSFGTTPKDNSPFAQFFRSTESNVERIIFDFRFLALLAVGGSLAGSLLCFLNGCVYIVEAYKVYWTNCAKGIHTGQMVLRLVEAIDVYLAGTVMLIFSMGLYGLFISFSPHDVPPESDRALKASSLFGMFAMKERPKWMKISSLDELKTKVGHVIVMILLVKMFERSKMVTIATGLDLLSYSVCIFLSSASLYILHNLHKGEQ